MISLDFDWQTNEFMLYCRTTQLREKSMMAYEQSLKLFQRWCMDEMGIFTVDKVTENVIRRYTIELQERGKYTLSGLRGTDGAGILFDLLLTFPRSCQTAKLFYAKRSFFVVPYNHRLF